MPAAARMFDPTGHPGVIMQGSPNVLIENQPAARVGDKHVCTLPPTAGPHPPSPIAKGSGTVLINGMHAARQFDTAGCGAPILKAALSVLIGD
ncbi:putative Zn-binding protein involved in type VI secretion [Paraburkholderia sp. JPY158]|uniref:Putative Zn-binding protein involved in type VI secretion n=1 Tax=Paraburkholderia atlantica TaxID=2654982 RepID=A0A7W8QES4_PARAM|nr:PAAR domain-containing protein [Paraburkholderia atlantica]MBB5429118.1 putative Zn-binding protein involved in type VI secretion [Paraburkholderia atlantica]